MHLQLYVSGNLKIEVDIATGMQGVRKFIQEQVEKAHLNT